MGILATASATVIVVGQTAISPVIPPPVLDAGRGLTRPQPMAPFVRVVDATHERPQAPVRSMRPVRVVDATMNQSLRSGAQQVIADDRGLSDVGSTILSRGDDGDSAGRRFQPFAETRSTGRRLECRGPARQPYSTSPVFGPIPNLWECEMFGPVPTLDEYLPRGSRSN